MNEIMSRGERERERERGGGVHCGCGGVGHNMSQCPDSAALLDLAGRVDSRAWEEPQLTCRAVGVGGARRRRRRRGRAEYWGARPASPSRNAQPIEEEAEEEGERVY